MTGDFLGFFDSRLWLHGKSTCETILRAERVSLRVELKIGPLRWTAQHTAYAKNRLFEDEQVQGPFAKWIHRHEFETLRDHARLTDRVEYQLPGGIWVNRLFGWVVQLALARMFRRRHETTKRYFEEGSNEENRT